MKTFSRLTANTIARLITIGLFLSLSLPAFAQTDGFHHGPGMMWGSGWGGGWGGMLVGPLMMLLFIVVAAVLVVFVVRWLGGTGGAQGGREGLASSPLGILQERFARGEIDREEYEERRSVLGE